MPGKLCQRIFVKFFCVRRGIFLKAEFRERGRDRGIAREKAARVRTVPSHGTSAAPASSRSAGFCRASPRTAAPPTPAGHPPRMPPHPCTAPARPENHGSTDPGKPACRSFDARVGWASCPPSDESCVAAFRRCPGRPGSSFGRDARTGGRDAHPTRDTPLAFERLIISERWYQTAGMAKRSACAPGWSTRLGCRSRRPAASAPVRVAHAGHPAAPDAFSHPSAPRCFRRVAGNRTRVGCSTRKGRASRGVAAV